MRKAVFFGSFMILVGGIFILSFSLTTVLTYLYRYNNYSQVKGSIVGYTIDNNGNKAMVISYNVDDEEYKINSNFTDEEKYPVGYGVLVRYDSKEPNRYILGDEDLKYINVIIGAVLTLIGSTGMVCTYGEKKNNKGDK